MESYSKIQSVFKRDPQTHKFIEGEFSLPEFEYLAENDWLWTEKVDGTNIRVNWDGQNVVLGGRTENAQIPAFLIQRLQDLFPKEKFAQLYSDMPMTLYGEGYGVKIQKSGGNYKADGVDFVLFDVLIDGWWLRRLDVVDVAQKLEAEPVPVVRTGDIWSAIDAINTGVTSYWGDFQAEGLVGKPLVELQTRAGQRIVTKMKHKDFA